MSIDWLREFCLSLPHTTEQIQWKDDLVFKVGGKMYAVTALEPGAHWLSTKCSDEDFAELVERPGILPAPYLARAHWVAIESEDTLPRAEMQQLLIRAHALVFSKLPKKTQAALSKPRAHRKNPRRARRRAARAS
jgi:predicted DNA-binding protein (MmcQ/YjbR family)